MGVYCEINLFKPQDGAFHAGQPVRGLIKYAVDEPMELDKITTSLKGRGDIHVIQKRSNKEDKRYGNSEVYIDLDHDVQDEKNLVPVGVFEIKFNFNLPYNIPPSTKIFKRMGRYTLRCNIKYYIRVKFSRPGFFAPNKHFRKKITILSGVTPTLLREPVMYGEKKKLTQLFSNKENIINVKATIFSSVVQSGGKIKLDYEVENGSSTLVKSVKIQLIEVYKYLSTYGFDLILPEDKVPDTDTKTPAIQCGHTQTMSIEMNIPSDIHSLEHSNIVSREYQVRIKAELPMPHRNILVNIPVQISSIDVNTEENGFQGIVEEIYFDDPPPSYWEAMGETKKEDDADDDSDEESDEGKSKNQIEVLASHDIAKS